MMTHDPFQNLQTLGAYFGGGTPFALPYTAFQPIFNPLGIAGQTQGNPGIGGYGSYPNPLQAGITSQLAPLQQLLAWNAPTAGLQHPLLQHLQALGAWQNPQLGYYPGYQAGYQGWPQQQAQYGYPQVPQQALAGIPASGQPFGQQQYGYPLAPQSFIGSGAIGQAIGQLHPLAQQMALRQAGFGISPLAGCF
jgi:hypothetical protein